MANRLFFALYQCANMLHKTGSRAVEAEGLTTQQWAVLGALSHPKAAGGMSINALARYLMVSRQNLSGVVQRMERAGHIQCINDVNDMRSRLVSMTPEGEATWRDLALPKIHGYYAQALDGFSLSDTAHALHYLRKLLGNMQHIDAGEPADEEAPAPAAASTHRRTRRRPG